MHAVEITDLHDPRVHHYCYLKQKALNHVSGSSNTFVAESYKVVRQLLHSEITVISLLATQEWLERLSSDIENSKSKPQLYFASKEQLEKIVGFELHQGVMAIGLRPENKILEDLDSKIIVLNGLFNPENVGAIIRSSVAFEFHSMIYDRFTAEPYLRRAARVSMGNVFRTKIHQSLDLVQDLKTLKARGYKIIGTDIHQPTAQLPDVKFPEKFALIIGSEVHGVYPEILNECDERVFIPTGGENLALNAAQSASVLFYAAKLSLNNAKSLSYGDTANRQLSHLYIP